MQNTTFGCTLEEPLAATKAPARGGGMGVGQIYNCGQRPQVDRRSNLPKGLCYTYRR